MPAIKVAVFVQGAVRRHGLLLRGVGVGTEPTPTKGGHACK